MKIDTTQAVEAGQAVSHCAGDKCVKKVIDAALPHLARAYREALLSAEAIVAAQNAWGNCYLADEDEDHAADRATVAALTAAADHVFGPPKADEEKK